MRRGELRAFDEVDKKRTLIESARHLRAHRAGTTCLPTAQAHCSRWSLDGGRAFPQVGDLKCQFFVFSFPPTALFEFCNVSREKISGSKICALWRARGARQTPSRRGQSEDLTIISRAPRRRGHPAPRRRRSGPIPQKENGAGVRHARGGAGKNWRWKDQCGPICEN